MTITPLKLLTDQFEERENGQSIDTLIIHSMYNPDAEDCFSVQACTALLKERGVSAHYVIDVDGTIYLLVEEENKAWHAGVSRMPHPADGREGVNAFSIGIELIGNEVEPFTDAQYEQLAALTSDITSRHPIKNIYGHVHIAPDRKTDPWGFDWVHFRSLLSELCTQHEIRFPADAFS